MYLIVCFLLISCFSLSSSEALPEKTVASDSEKLLYQVLGIYHVDRLYAQHSPQTPGKSPACVKTLRAWLGSSIDEITECDPLLVEFGKAVLEKDKSSTNGSQLYNEDDVKRIKHWCALLAENHEQSRKRPMLSHALMARDLLSSLVEDPVAQSIATSSNFIHEHDIKRYRCEQIRRSIGSFFALKAAQHAQKRHGTRGDAQSLYNELVLESYHIDCDAQVGACVTGFIPKSLQLHIESFLYDPRQIVYDLHSVETPPCFVSSPQEDKFFLVANEDFVEFIVGDNKSKRTQFWGFMTSGITDELTRNVMAALCKTNEMTASYRIKKIRGGPDSYYLEADLSNGQTLGVLSQRQSSGKGEVSPLCFTFPSAGLMCSVANGRMDTMWRQVICNDGEYGTDYMSHNITRLCVKTNNNIRLELLATNDSGSVVYGLGRDAVRGSQAPFTYLYSAGYDKTLSKIIPYDLEILAHKLFDPVLALSHSGKWAVLAGRNEDQQMMLALFLTDKKLVKECWQRLTWEAGKLKKLVFSRDDTRLFGVVEGDEKKKIADTYHVMDLRQDPYSCTFVPCKMPRLKDKDISCISSIDPYGEYIGVRGEGTDGALYRLIPTDHHTDELVSKFQSLRAKDRHMLYLLHETIQRAPGIANISPEQWLAFEQLGVRAHLLYRSLLCLKDPTGKKMWGTPHMQGKERVREASLQQGCAVYAASNFS